MAMGEGPSPRGLRGRGARAGAGAGGGVGGGPRCGRCGAPGTALAGCGEGEEGDAAAADPALAGALVCRACGWVAPAGGGGGGRGTARGGIGGRFGLMVGRAGRLEGRGRAAR